jgi:hypothetical protein
MTPAERQQVRAQVVASRRRQGHADSVQDAALYARLAAKLVFSALNDTSGPAVGRRAAQPPPPPRKRKADPNANP